MVFSSFIFRMDSPRDIGRALRSLVGRMSDEVSERGLWVLSPPDDHIPGAVITIIPPGIRLVEQHDISRDADIGRFDVWYDVER